LTVTNLTDKVFSSTLEVNMRLLLGLFSALVLALCASLFATQQPQTDACHFTVQGSAERPQISGPPDLLPLVYVVDQPDSPLEITSINLDALGSPSRAIATPRKHVSNIRFAIAVIASFNMSKCPWGTTGSQVPVHSSP
jgi:hypothetical protein